MPLPTFVIAGAQKCGTTSLAAALRQHRQVHVSRPKELHFFDRPLRARAASGTPTQFSPRDRHAQIGEATPVYLDDPVARERLIQTLPDAKIVIILRNPVDRAYSHYWHKRRLGSEPLATLRGRGGGRAGARAAAARRHSWLRPRVRRPRPLHGPDRGRWSPPTAATGCT